MHLRKFSLLTVCCLAISIASFSKSNQSGISIKNVTADPVLPANIRDWNGAMISLTAISSKEPESPFSKLVVQIRKGDKIICGNAPEQSSLTIAPFTTRNFSVSDFSEALVSCTVLTPGTYSICFRFFNEQNEPISDEACQEFSVREYETAVINPPRNLAPADNKNFIGKDANAPVTFKWTAVSPLPGSPIIYRLRIWPMSESQSAAQAIASSQPVFTNDIKDATEVVFPEGLPAPCKEPYRCKYIWNVQALNKELQPVGSNNGYSQPTAIIATSYIIRIDSIKVSCTATPGIYAFSYTIANVNPGTAKLTNFVVTSSLPSGATISSFSPPLNTNITSGAQLTITGTISASSSLSNICIGAEITDLANSFNKASKDTCITVAPCKCDLCDPKKTNINITPTTNIVVNANNTLTLTQPITITTTPLRPVKDVRAELMYFEFVPESEDCLPCNKDSKTFGNLDVSTLAAVTAAGTGTHSLLWIFSPPKNFSTASNAVITITMPPTVKCCAATIRWCIRYVITFNDCSACSKIVCYEKKKDGCAAGSGNGNPNSNNN